MAAHNRFWLAVAAMAALVAASNILVQFQINDWLTSLGLAPVTVTNYRRILHNLFAEAVRMKAVPSNPVTHAIKPKLTETEIGILTVPQARALLRSRACRAADHRG